MTEYIWASARLGRVENTSIKNSSKPTGIVKCLTFLNCMQQLMLNSLSVILNTTYGIVFPCNLRKLVSISANSVTIHL
jgi:hypothetical protein